jgi:transposase
MSRYEQGTGQRRVVGPDRAAAAAGAPQAEGRPAPGAGSRRAYRHPLRAAQRDSVGVTTPGDGLRQRGDLLAALARLAARRGVAATAPGAVRSAGPGGPPRLVSGEPGQPEPPGEKRGPATGPNPTDRGKAGSKHQVLVERQGIPLAEELTAANVPDGCRCTALVDTVAPVRQPRGAPRRRPAKVHADKASDSARCRAGLRHRGIVPRIARQRIASSEHLGRYRWVAERTLAWIAQYRRLELRYERLPEIHAAFLCLASSLICFKFLADSF